MEVPDLTVVIVSWNVADLLGDCLRSLFAAEDDMSMEVFVVDNGSTDGTVDMVRESFPQVALIANADNAGFARANNQAIRICRGRYILLLNPDTLVAKGIASKMIRFLDDHPAVGALGPMIRTAEGAIDYRAGRRFPTPLTDFFEHTRLSDLFPSSRIFGRTLMGYWNHDDSRDVDLLSGACMMVRRETVDDVGPLDEDFFLYGEDVEWCYRIRKRGWRIHYYADAEIVHLGGKSSSRAPQGLGLDPLRSLNLFFRKCYGVHQAWFHRGLILLVALAKEGLFVIHFLRARDGMERERARRKIRLHCRVLRWATGLRP